MAERSKEDQRGYRSFLAFPLSDELIGKYAVLLERVRRADPKIKLGDPFFPHATEIYLGVKSLREIDTIAKIVDQYVGELSGLFLEVAGLGVFEKVSNRCRRLCWHLGVEHPDDLSAFHHRVVREIRENVTYRGYEPERHVTLGFSSLELDDGVRVNPEIVGLTDGIHWRFEPDEMVIYGKQKHGGIFGKKEELEVIKIPNLSLTRKELRWLQRQFAAVA